ncbi:MAG: hypothetical protein ABUS79_03555 [Pseudomonadota bacterium]
MKNTPPTRRGADRPRRCPQNRASRSRRKALPQVVVRKNCTRCFGDVSDAPGVKVFDCHTFTGWRMLGLRSINEGAMAIFASKRDAKKSEASVETAPAAKQTEAASASVGSKALADGGDGPAAPPAGDANGGGNPIVTPAGSSLSVAPSITSEAVDIEPVDIEPVDIEATATGVSPVAFGIADTIRLMRSLPADPNIDLVVRVVRVTLGAVNVSVDEIMADAARKESQIKDGIASLETQIADMEKQLYTKRCEITALEADLKETASVREKLHLADKYTGPRPPPPPADATRIVHPKPSEWAAEWERADQSKRG